MARQLAERFQIAHAVSDVGEMLARLRPDVVHITTPPQSHLGLARQCLEAGAHVYIEKPFTVTGDEAALILELAAGLRLSVTAGHNYQFTPEMRTMRQLVSSGYLGGPPVHVESYWAYDLGDASYVAPLLASPEHWVRKLPGGLLHNIVSHGIARIAEFLDDEIVEVKCMTHQSARMRALGGGEVMDELRVLIRDSRETTAYFCFTTQARPGPNQLRVWGPENSIDVDLVSGTVFRRRGRSFKSYLTFVVPPLLVAGTQIANSVRNLTAILRWRLYQDSGMKDLVEAFHRSIAEGGAPPIPYREILLTARLMDAIFANMNAGRTVTGQAGDEPTTSSRIRTPRH